MPSKPQPTTTTSSVGGERHAEVGDAQPSQVALSLIEQILEDQPEGALRTTRPANDDNDGGEGLALVEGFRGDILAWVRLAADGRLARCHLRDPSWFQWPLLEAAIAGNIVADFPLCNKSFNCSYSGHDL